MQAGIEAQSYGIVAVSLVVSLLTMYSMTKIWRFAYWQSAPEIIVRPIDYSRRGLIGHYAPVIVLVVVTLTIGLSAETFFTIAQEAATQLIGRTPYITAVLGGG